MSPIKVIIHSTGTGICSLTGKEAVDGLTVTFEDGTVNEAHLSWKSFKQLLSLHSARVAKTATKPPAGAMSLNGPTVVAAK